VEKNGLRKPLWRSQARDREADDGVVSWLALKTVARPIRKVYLNPRQTKVILRAAAPKFKLNN
jgi:hypothetical protein